MPARDPVGDTLAPAILENKVTVTPDPKAGFVWVDAPFPVELDEAKVRGLIVELWSAYARCWLGAGDG